MVYERVQKNSSSWSPAFHQDKSESLFRPRPFSIQPEADTDSAEEQEIPAYSRADRDAISAKLLNTMGANVQTQVETESQKPESESEELDSEEMSNETETLQRLSESPESGDDDENSPNRGAIQRHVDNSESEPHFQGIEAEESDEEMSLEAGAIQRQSESEDLEDEVKSVQTKLTVGAPGDKYEQEADSVAAQVMSMSVQPAPSMPIQRQGEEEEQEPLVQRSSLADSITPLVQRLREEQEEPLQAKSLLQRAGNGNALAGSNVENQLTGSKGGGSPLPNEVRSFMEPRFGADFSSVRVHTDSTAVQMNKELGAQAFAHGSDIYYGAGKSPGNNELTAHELTHTIQQGGAVRLNKQVQRQAKEEEQETLQAKELSNHPGEVTLNKEVQPAETLVAKALPGDASQLSLNKEVRLKPEATAQETEAQPIQAKQYTSLNVSSVSPRIQGDFFGIPTSLEEAKRKILSPVVQLASGIPGYPLLKVILGKDPISETPVERNPTNLIQGVLSLVPKGQEFFANLQQSGAIDKAYNWFNQQIAKLNLTWETIKGLFKRAWDSLGMGDLVSPSGAFEKIKNVFTEPIGRIKTFAVNAGTKVMEFVFEGVMGGGGAKVMEIIRNAGGVFNTIISDPIKFVGNLVGAVKGGFQQFSGNILTHLKNGLVGWLFGALAGAGLTLPGQFDLKGIVSLVVQVLGLTYQRMRGMLVKLIGEPKVAKLEKAFDFLMMIVDQGLGAAWEKITEFVGGLQEMVMGGIREWVQNSIITAAITKLLSMFNPAGAVIQAVMAIYNTIMFFIERGSQIAALGEAVFSSIGTIAVGNIAGAATYVEQTMGRTLPVVISFLARLIGLGGISEQIKNVIKKIQDPIETAMNKVANFIVENGKSLLGKGKGTNTADADPEHDRKVKEGLQQLHQKEAEYAQNGGLTQEDAQKVAAKVKSEHPVFKSISVVDGVNKWKYEYVASPKEQETSRFDKKEDEVKGAFALYRGIHFKNNWNKEDYEAQLKINLVGEPTFSAAAREIAGSKKPDGSDVSKADLETAAELVREKVEKTKDTNSVRQWWGKKTQAFDSLFLAMIQDYVNRYSKFEEELQKAERGQYSGLEFISIPLISTSKNPEHAARYALGEKGTLKDNQRSTGKALGRLFVYLFTAKQLVDQGAINIQYLQNQGKVRIKTRILNEAEVAFTGSIPGENLVTQHDAKPGDSAKGLGATAEQTAQQKAQSQGGLREWES
jgi:hypothetical protein